VASLILILAAIGLVAAFAVASLSHLVRPAVLGRLDGLPEEQRANLLLVWALLPLLTGLLVGQTLHTSAPEIYRALIEATGFGARTIVERLEEYGVEVREVVNCGGIAEKNPMLMQIYADVTGREMKISRSGQTCALGSAVAAAVVGGAYPSFDKAQAAMCGMKETTFRPIPENHKVYQRIYKLYRQLHDAFGLRDNPIALGHVMKDLLAIKEEANA